MRNLKRIAILIGAMVAVMLVILGVFGSAKAAEPRVDTMIEFDSGPVDVDPVFCRAIGRIAYENGPLGLTLTIEKIQCADKIFADGFDTAPLSPGVPR